MPAPPLNIGLEARYPAGGSNRLERGYCLVALDPDGEYTAYDHDPFEVRFAETPQDGVGGIGEFPQIHERGSFAPDLSGEDHGLSASIIAGVIGGVTVLVSAAWYIRRRRRKAT